MTSSRRLRPTDSASTGVARRPTDDAGVKPVALIGFMGAGKTTIGRELDAGALDSDREIERRAGQSISEIFALRGETGFRRIEQEVVIELIDSAAATPIGNQLGRVVSLGGGAVLSAAVREALERCLVVWIEIDVETAWRRAGSGTGDRPLARDRVAFENLYAERHSLYLDLADVVLPSSALAGSDTVRRAREAQRIRRGLETLAQLPRQTRMLWAHSAGSSYPVYVGPGLIGTRRGFALLPDDERAGTYAPWPLRGRRYLVTDQTVGAELDRVREGSGLGALGAGPEQGLFAIPPGESAKTLATVEQVITAMAANGFTRADHVVAVGGGVVGDLGGFCAAVYQRGVPVVQVPTTVVAQVDSAYGGKTGVDLPTAKNYIGAYHQPAAVITDPALLTSLPKQELAAGFVELLKTGLLAGGRLWDAVTELEPGSARALAEHPYAIFDCARFKCGVVAADERDGGLRQILNLGHTVGHAIESATGYVGYRHGEAVGLGLLAALRLSGADRLRDQVESILAAWDLPLRIDPAACAAARSGAGHEDFPAVTPRLIAELTHKDKKRLGDKTPFVLLSEPGDPRYGQRVAATEVLAAIEELFSG